METILGILFFILGSIIGSFLNVVSMRYGTGTITKKRSFCMSCSKKLNWYEMFPIFSYIFLRGRCSSCKSRISIENPFFEIVTGLVFVLVFLKFGISLYSLFLLIIFSILLIISAYDFNHKVIPDGLVYSFITISFLGVFVNFSNLNFDLEKMENILAGIIVPLPFFLLWLISKGKWIGLGDSKLMIGIGLVLGILRGFYAVFIGFWIGALFSLFMILFQKIRNQKSLSMKSEIPLGPFLVLGFVLEILFEFNLLF